MYKDEAFSTAIKIFFKLSRHETNDNCIKYQTSTPELLRDTTHWQDSVVCSDTVTNFKHPAPIRNTTWVENLSEALNIHFRWYAAEYNIACVAGGIVSAREIKFWRRSQQASCEAATPAHAGYIQRYVLYRNMSPTMSDPTHLVRDYNIRPRQCQNGRFSC